MINHSSIHHTLHIYCALSSVLGTKRDFSINKTWPLPCRDLSLEEEIKNLTNTLNQHDKCNNKICTKFSGVTKIGVKFRISEMTVTGNVLIR